MRRTSLLIAASVGLAAATAGAQAQVVALPDVNIEVASPSTPAAPAAPATPAVPAGESYISNTPSSQTTISAKTIARTASPNVADVLQRAAPGVDIQGTSGNTFQPDVVYHGFLASPIAGTPQGLAVYQNGIRVNEAFGDNMNWDEIPTLAIASMRLVSNDPAYGLNALGGALDVRMKNGFNFKGGKLDVSGGSYGRIQAGMEYGETSGHYAFYGALEGVHDEGFRLNNTTSLKRFYGDLGYRNEGNEVHFALGLADNNFAGTGPTPVQMLQKSWSSVYTTPQTTEHQMGMASLTGKFDLAPSWTLTTAAYVRRYLQNTVDGNTTNVEACPTDPSLLCYQNGDGTYSPANGTNGQQLANPFPPNAVLGEIDRTSVRTTSLGGNFLLSNDGSLFGHKNHAAFGASYDFGLTSFNATAQIGMIDPNLLVSGGGPYLGPTGNPVTDGPVDVHTVNRYLGVNAFDAFDVSDKLTLTGGARFNFASISLFDQLGGNITGEHQYAHVNPLVGLTYKITPELQAYASFAEANRAPTPLELGCANPQQPCILASFLVADPNLQQVVTQTVEAGLRGENDFGAWGALNWKAGAYRTLSINDIMNLPAPNQQGFGYFANVGDTLREGLDAQIRYRIKQVTLGISYAYINATFLNSLALASNSPSADANGLIYVVPGDQIPMIPRNRFNISADWDINSKARVGADVLFVGAQRYAGDASNQQPLLPAYFTVGVNGSYKITDKIEVYARAENLLNHRYYTYGTYFETDALTPVATFTNAEMATPGQPLSVYGGVRMTF